MGIGALRRHYDRYASPSSDQSASGTQQDFEQAFENSLTQLLEEGKVDLQKDTVQEIKQKVVTSKHFKR